MVRGLNLIQRHHSENALRSVFGKYFKTKKQADQYARQPEKIVNRVYANRMGNGDDTRAFYLG